MSVEIERKFLVKGDHWRSLATGKAIDVLCSEDVLATQAMSAANWSVMVGGVPSLVNTVGAVEQVQQRAGAPALAAGQQL